MNYYLTVCAIMKNEGPYLKEWIEFHRMVGVEHFYLYDNGSSDETPMVIKPYVQQNLVTLHGIPERRAQLKAYMHCLSTYRTMSRWIAFIDLDEFIVPLSTETLSEFLKGFEEFAALGVNWIIYGDSGHQTRPDGLVAEQFVHRAPEDWRSNCHIKSIVDPQKVKSPFNPHHFRYVQDAYAVNENRERVDGSLSRENSTKKIRINHYFTRSVEDSRKKMERGSAFTNTKRPWKDFERLNRNDIKDTTMEKYLPELRKRVFGD